ncbi:hypothetical protein YC2023_057597 [Brassica napus]
MRRGCIYRKLLTDLRRLSDEIPTDIKKSVGIPSELSNPKRLYNGHMYLSATVTWFVGIPSENTDGIPTTLLLIGMSSEFRRNIPTNFRRLQRIPSQMSDDLGVRRNLRRNSVCFLVVQGERASPVKGKPMSSRKDYVERLRNKEERLLGDNSTWYVFADVGGSRDVRKVRGKSLQESST